MKASKRITLEHNLQTFPMFRIIQPFSSLATQSVVQKPSASPVRL